MKRSRKSDKAQEMLVRMEKWRSSCPSAAEEMERLLSDWLWRDDDDEAFDEFMLERINQRFSAMENVMAGVYGPPEVFGISLPLEDGSAAEEFDPLFNCEVCDYGPPEVAGVEEACAGEEADADTVTEEFDPPHNFVPCVYGPPEVFGMQMPPVFVPEDNCEPDVYGPPQPYEDPEE